MIWRLVIFSELLGLFLPLAAATVSGQTALVQSTAAVVKKKRDFSGVVVWLIRDDDGTAHSARKQHAQMLQKDKRFVPHILPIETGTTVDFPNLDPIFHNAFSNYDGQIFDVALYPPGTSRSIRFDRPGVDRVFCNIHPTMSAIIVVVDSKYFTTTDHAGRYTFSDVPPGAYHVHFFHERATADTLSRLTEPIIVRDEPSEVALAYISEAGYLPTAHKNKYGQSYPDDKKGAIADTYSLPTQ